MQVAVVILNWNGKKFLEQFLPLVMAHTGNDAEVYVADNASNDDSVQFLKKNHPDVHLIQNPLNGGFAVGYNMALTQIKADYYVLLNSDVEVTADWVKAPVDMLKNNLDVVAVQPKIKSFFEPQKFEYAGAAGGFIDVYGYPFCRGRIFDTIEKDEGQYNDEKEIFWATGACLFIKASVFHEMGGFDEDLFSHQEEIDLCWRMKLKGYKIMYCPNSEVLHYGGGMLPKSNPFKTYLNFRNNLIILCKNHPARALRKMVFQRMILDGLAALRFLLKADFGDFWAITRAHAHFYRTLKKTWAKRKKVQATVTNPEVSAIYRRSIVRKYFLQGKRVFSELDSRDFY
ncbi:MAG TPA: glycosyltransferase family 2 protein [Bacteroidia bacterium]|jgi:GT2 family glycosyltransferase|nr:glycosyltransferase family 2 protein [Bacteroidia bacterium]